MNKIYSIGHSNLPLDVFIGKLHKNSIHILVDVRTRPYSRWYPHFNREVLARAVERYDIAYLWKGANLGGLGENVDFEKNIQWLADLAKTGQRVAVMCSERDYRKCHRHLVIEKKLNNYLMKILNI